MDAPKNLAQAYLCIGKLEAERDAALERVKELEAEEQWRKEKR